MKRRWPYILLGLALALLLARQIRGQSDVDPALADRATAYDVEILRDGWGVPHILGETDADAAFGLAYAHAEDDFGTIQGVLLAARGELARVFGADAAPNDYMVALLRVQEIAREGWEQLDSASRALCDGYADGLNVFAAQHRTEALPGLFPVAGVDVVAGFVHRTPLFFGLDTVLGSLFAEDTPDDPSAVATFGVAAGAGRSLLAGAERTRSAGRAPVAGAGSNALAVAPSRTADGSTMLAVNSHQPWTGPVAWYEAHMMSREGLNMLGGTFPGSPVILHGHNQHLGWAHTVNTPDVLDLYTLEVNPEDPGMYRYDGAWRQFESGTADIAVRLLGPLQWTMHREILWSVHGPVVRTDEGAVALRFAGWGDSRQVTQWYRMNRADRFDAWYEAMAMQAVPVFNTVYADATGRIGYLYNARLPDRPDAPADWAGRVDGGDPSLVWSQYVPLTQLPQVIDPPVGFVQNANSTPYGTTGTEADPDDGLLPASAGIETHMTNRALRARALLTGDASITWSEFLAYKYDLAYADDARAAALRRQVLFAGEPEADDLLTRALDVMRRWDLRTDSTNRQAALPVLAFQPYLEAYGQAVSSADLLARVRWAASHLEAVFGTLEPAWSDVNRLRRGGVDLGIAGGPDVLHAVYGQLAEDGRLVGNKGDSYVLMVRWPAAPIPPQTAAGLSMLSGGATPESWSVQPFGSATSRPESPHYADQSRRFVARHLKAMPFIESAVRAAAVRTYRPGRSDTRP